MSNSIWRTLEISKDDFVWFFRIRVVLLFCCANYVTYKEQRVPLHLPTFHLYSTQSRTCIVTACGDCVGDRWEIPQHSPLSLLPPLTVAHPHVTQVNWDSCKRNFPHLISIWDVTPVWMMCDLNITHYVSRYLLVVVCRVRSWWLVLIKRKLLPKCVRVLVPGLKAMVYILY